MSSPRKLSVADALLFAGASTLLGYAFRGQRRSAESPSLVPAEGPVPAGVDDAPVAKERWDAPHAAASRRHSWSAFQLLAVAVVAAALGVLSTQADQKLAALGLTLVAVATFLATPRLVANSYALSVEARLRRRWRDKGATEERRQLVARRWLTLLCFLGAVAAALLVLGYVFWHDGDLGVVLYLGGVGLWMTVAVAAYVVHTAGLMWQLVFAEGGEHGDDEAIPKPTADDRAAALALVLFLLGVACSFADAYSA